MITIVHHPGGSKRLGELLVDNFKSRKWSSFRAAIAFAKRSGVKHIAPSLTEFAKRAHVKISLGIDQCGTSVESVEDLLKAVGTKGELWLFHNEAANSPTFHPKVYLFSNSTAAECFIGSGNLTEGGLFTNYEAFVHLHLNRGNTDDETLLKQAENLLNQWTASEPGTALKVNLELITKLKARGDLPTEAEINRRKAATNKVIKGGVLNQATKLFASVPVSAAPRVASEVAAKRSALAEAPEEVGMASVATGFVITLQNTDVGVGQTSKGASRRSPELFLPKVCVNAKPDFWGWPNLFKADPEWTGPVDREGFGKMDREAVRMRLGTTTLSVNWWYNPGKKDFRTRNEALRSAGNIGDILRIEPIIGEIGFDYYVEIIPKGTSQFERFEAMCTEPVRNSLKKWGYY